MADIDQQFPCSLVINLPFPSHRLASSALQAIEVDAELSPLVQRTLSLTSAPQSASVNGTVAGSDGNEEDVKTVMRTEYKATTNRMLRVAVNGFMESLSVVLGVMEELDVDVLDPET